MAIQMVCRYGVVLFVVALMAGCASHPRRSGQSAIGNQCPTQASCNYNGQYEPGERDYAEQEARRLNQQQTQRLQRSGGWW
ncbi:MAG TPA: hypothetical protein VF285_00925 [Castellaniella sp.]|uniref:hypothetical protein n=1 Tax=Castellaniella sp. TaxID=1955812 RepID=UPI002F0DD7B7